MAISLKIKGNKRTNEGIGNDLISIGDNRFPVTDAQYPGTKGATDFIVIRHLHDKSIYTIVCKNVTPCDSNREGTLYISVSVPVKEHVEGLFNMLIELQNAYKSTCMTYDGTMYHFMAREDAPQTFAEILSRHKVVRYPYKAVATSDDLSAAAYLFMSPEQISDLLNDPMRGEFSRYGEIVLVPVADPSQYVSTINVPAKIWRSYKIYVNGRQTGQTLSDPNKTVTITLPETSSHESVAATFSISQARDTRMPGIAVDDEAQIIYLNMQPKPKPVIVTPKEDSHAGNNPGRKNRNLYIIVAAITVAVLAVLAYVLFLAPSDEKGKEPDKTEINKGGENKKNGDDGKTGNGENVGDAEALESVDDTGDNTDEANGDGNADTNGKGNVIEPDPSEKLLDKKGTEKNATEELKNEYNSDKGKINAPENLKFRDFDRIYKRHTNFDKQEGYREYKRKVDFIKEVVDYIKNLDDNIPTADYKNKITGFENRAEELGLTGLKAKLHNRINPISNIQKSKQNKASF